MLPRIVFLFFSSLDSIISWVRILLVCAEKLMFTMTRLLCSCSWVSFPFAITDYIIWECKWDVQMVNNCVELWGDYAKSYYAHSHSASHNIELTLHTFPTPVVPVKRTEWLTSSNFSNKNPNLCVSMVGTKMSKKGVCTATKENSDHSQSSRQVYTQTSGLYTNCGMVFSHASRRLLSMST